MAEEHHVDDANRLSEQRVAAAGRTLLHGVTWRIGPGDRMRFWDRH